MKELYTDLIEESDFHRAWAIAITMVLANGTDLVIGGVDQRKPIKDSCMLISLTGNAIKQIEAKEIHPQSEFKNVTEYCREYTWEYLKEYDIQGIDKRHPYLYYDRLVRYLGYNDCFIPPINQLAWMREMLAEQIKHNITSNRVQAITWYPSVDTRAVSPACLQRGQVRYIPEMKVDVHLTWRSRDLLHAWQSNVICVIEMLNREVIKPNNCQIARIVDFSDSLHIYKTDIGEAEKVKLPATPL